MTRDRAEIAVSEPIVDDLAPLPPEPYPGLRWFESTEWAIFFGREPMIDEVITRLLDRQIVAVHGSSGCGKSSLIRAGVLPWLQMEHARGNFRWKTASMRPGSRPLYKLSQALAETLGAPSGTSPEQAVDMWHDRLALGEWRGAIEHELAGSQRLCLLIDQFEELFRYAREGGREEAQLFVELLCESAESPIPGLFIILAMRSDYIGQCAQFEGFAEVVDRCQYLLPRMDDLALLRAIHEPARLFGGAIDAKVADRLLFASRRDEDSLPILQHTLMRACSHARKRSGPGNDWVVTLEDLQKAEGQNGALSTHADEVLGKLALDSMEVIATTEWVFRSLADIDREGQIVRRPCPLSELVEIAGGKEADAIKIVDAFRARDCSFLMPPPTEKLNPDTIVDVGHEALLRQWTRISGTTFDPVTREPAGWLLREIEDGRRWRFLAVQAQEFMRDRQAVLSPVTTAAYERWWPAHNQVWATRHAQQRKDAAKEFVEVRELWEASRRGARKSRRWRMLRLSLGGISATAIIILAVSVYFSQDLSLSIGLSASLFFIYLLFTFVFAIVYMISSIIALMQTISALWSRIRVRSGQNRSSVVSR